MAQFLDFEDVKIKSKFPEKYKGIPGEIHRIGIIWPNISKEEKDKGVKKGPFESKFTHFVQEAKKGFLCKEGFCCSKLGPAEQRFGCMVIKYKTQKEDGKIIKSEDPNLPFYFEVLPWIFSAKKFNQLKGIHNEWDLKTIDLRVSCSGEVQYQDLTLTPCKESFWQMKEQYKNSVYSVSESLRENLERNFADDLSIDEIKELLGMGTQKSISDTISTPEQLDDVINSLGI